MGIFKYIAQVALMADSSLFATNRRAAGKPTGKGNNTTDITKRKAKKKKFVEYENGRRTSTRLRK